MLTICNDGDWHFVLKGVLPVQCRLPKKYPCLYRKLSPEHPYLPQTSITLVTGNGPYRKWDSEKDGLPTLLLATGGCNCGFPPSSKFHQSILENVVLKAIFSSFLGNIFTLCVSCGFATPSKFDHSILANVLTFTLFDSKFKVIFHSAGHRQTFLHCVFSNANSNRLHERMESNFGQKDAAVAEVVHTTSWSHQGFSPLSLFQMFPQAL